jgi:hypothetical protein
MPVQPKLGSPQRPISIPYSRSYVGPLAEVACRILNSTKVIFQGSSKSIKTKYSKQGLAKNISPSPVKIACVSSVQAAIPQAP